MNRPFLACAFFTVASAALAAQQANPYQGTSNPPTDDVIVTTTTPQPKPPAGKPMQAVPAAAVQVQAQAPAQPQAQPQSQPSSVDPSVNDPDAAQAPAQAPDANQAPAPAMPGPAAQPPEPALQARIPAEDPDGDIVHPAPLGPGQLGDGTNIRVKLLDRLSTWDSEKGQPFHSQVAYDVLQGGQVVIPAGTEIDGTVVEASSGHFGGHGSMRLRPEVVIFPDGTQYHLHALITGTPGSRTRVGAEGTILPGSRMKRDVIEYAGVVGAGAVTGAFLGGPVGAVTGSAIGAGAVTGHLLLDHPQATLEPGAVLQFTLTDTLTLTPASPTGN